MQSAHSVRVFCLTSCKSSEAKLSIFVIPIPLSSISHILKPFPLRLSKAGRLKEVLLFRLLQVEALVSKVSSLKGRCYLFSDRKPSACSPPIPKCFPKGWMPPSQPKVLQTHKCCPGPHGFCHHGQNFCYLVRSDSCLRPSLWLYMCLYNSILLGMVRAE